MQVPKRVRDAALLARSDEKRYGFGSITTETAGRQPCPAKDTVINGGDSSATTSDKEIKQVPPNNNKSDNHIAVKRRPPDPGLVAAFRSPGKKPKPLEESVTELPAAQNNKPEDCEDKCAQLTVRSKGKDRHSKVKTAKGLRDRRVRLSAPTAIQFFDVQDRLGFDQPSKAVDWLLKKAKEAIDELTLLQQQHLLKAKTTQTVAESKDNNEVTTNSTHFDGEIATPKLEKESPAESPVQSPSVKKSQDQKNKMVHAGDQEKDRAGSRAKARERARERASLMKGKDSFAAKAAANTAKEGFDKCKDEHGIHLVADGPNVEAPTKDIEVVATITQAQYSCPPPLLMEQQQQDFSNSNTSAAANSTCDVAPYSELNHHHLFLKQQQAMQASLFSYLLSNAPYDGNAVASQGNNSNNNRPWQEVRPMYNDDNGDDSAAALGFQQSKTSLLIPAQGVAGRCTDPHARCNGNSDIDEREKANLMYSHMLVGHYQADSTILQTASISPYNQTPTPILPPAPPPPRQFSLKNNDKTPVQRMTMASNNINTNSTSSFEQQVSPGHGSAVWSSYNSIGLPYNHPSSSTGGTLQSIFSPAYSSSNSHQQLLVFTTSGGGGQTPSSSLSSASSGVFNMNMNTSTASITPSTWVHAGSMADEMQEGAETGLVQLPPHAANSWSHR